MFTSVNLSKWTCAKEQGENGQEGGQTMRLRKFSIFVAGFAMGAVVVWVAGVISRPPIDNLYETGILNAPGIAVWYKSFASEDGSFKNELSIPKSFSTCKSNSVGVSAKRLLIKRSNIKSSFFKNTSLF